MRDFALSTPGESFAPKVKIESKIARACYAL
jgi:hypothetical protein